MVWIGWWHVMVALLLGVLGVSTTGHEARPATQLSAWIPYYAHYLPSCTPVRLGEFVSPSALFHG